MGIIYFIGHIWMLVMMKQIIREQYQLKLSKIFDIDKLIHSKEGKSVRFFRLGKRTLFP